MRENRARVMRWEGRVQKCRGEDWARAKLNLESDPQADTHCTGRPEFVRTQLVGMSRDKIIAQRVTKNKSPALLECHLH